MSEPGARSDDAVRREASDWVALIHDADAAVDRAAFERWRASDPRHAAAYARAERAWDSAALLGQTSFGRVRSLPERRRIFDRPPVRYAFAVAAVLVVAILGLSVSGVGLLRSHPTSQATELASRVGQIRQVALADGSTVTLDAKWTAGMLTFDSTRLADAITQANRYSTARISLADPTLGDLRITGAFHVGDTAGLAQSVADSLGLRAAKTPQGDVVISAPPSVPAT